MLEKKINNLSKKKTVLLVPLDWGLGHATRCIPLIRELQSNGCEVIVGAENNIRSLLEHEFQQLRFLPLPGYRIAYSKKRYWLPLKILLQIPKILYHIFLEHQWLKKVEKIYEIDAVISDNRFGLFHNRLPCIYITHQLLIKTGNFISQKIAQLTHYYFIRRYSACWVPDFAGKENVAGELSHPNRLPANICYIGCLSRFDQPIPLVKCRFLLIIISGPEPQRSIFEAIVLNQLKKFRGTAMLIRGLPGISEKKEEASSSKNDFPKNVVIKNHLNAIQMNEAILESEWVVSRSGYTTIMDLLKLKKLAILVPTPGQTEQEYLAMYLMEKRLFFSVKQENFLLESVLEQAQDFPFAVTNFDMSLYKNSVQQFVQSL